MKQNQLLKGWVVSGSNAEELRTVLGNISKSTKCVKLNSGDVGYYIAMKHPFYEEALVRATTSPIDGDSVQIISRAQFLTSTPAQNWEEEVRKEAFGSKLFVSYFDGEKQNICFADEEIPSSITFLGISGDCCKEISWAWLSLVKQLTNDQGKIKLVIRESDDGVQKALTLRSAQYMYVPQDQLLELTEDICQNGRLQHYSVSNQYTEVQYSFDFMRIERTVNGRTVEIIPKIRFTTSDSGDSSFRWKLGWECDGRTVFLSPGKLEVAGRHKGEWSEKRYVEAKEDVRALFEKTTILDERLEILDKELIDFTEVEDVVRNFMSDNKKFCQLVKKEIREQIVQEAVSEFMSPVNTAAEIALFLMGVPEKLENFAPSTIYSLRQACGDFLYQTVRREQSLVTTK